MKNFDGIVHFNHLPMEHLIKLEKEFEWVALRDVYSKELSIKNWEFI